MNPVLVEVETELEERFKQTMIPSEIEVIEMICIRDAHSNDFIQLAEIYNSARSTAGCFSGKPVDPAEMKALTEGEAVHVAELDNQLAGFASVWAAANFIHHLYVLPDFHGQGVGSRLLDFCKERYGPMSLKCEISNSGAQRFYQNKGWIARERGTGEDGAWLWLYSPRCSFPLDRASRRRIKCG